jgi:[ribosomal protein S18]-alanine N-acetyltransferase
MQPSAQVMVRRAVAADIDRVFEIDRAALYVSHWSRNVYEKYEGEPREDFFHRCLLVAVEDGVVIGFAAGSFLEGDDAALLENLTVDVNWRRRGVARALCAALIDWAKSEGALGLDLEVRVTNEAARALYASLQFVEQGRRKKYYRDPEEDGVLMGLRFRQVSDG